MCSYTGFVAHMENLENLKIEACYLDFREKSGEKVLFLKILGKLSKNLSSSQ